MKVEGSVLVTGNVRVHSVMFSGDPWCLTGDELFCLFRFGIDSQLIGTDDPSMPSSNLHFNHITINFSMVVPEGDFSERLTKASIAGL